MEFSRRDFICCTAGATALCATSPVAAAPSYPTRPVRVIVNDAPAGAPDIAARLMGQWLSDRLGQQFVVENRPGGGGTIGTEAAVRAAPDGYTLLIVSTTTTIDATMYDKVDFNIVRDIAPVAGIVRVPLVMVINPAFPARTVGDFVAYAKSNPGKLNMASAGNGSAPHVAGALFGMMAGVTMVHVPFRGGPPALTAVLGGQVDVYFVATSSSIEYIRAGKLRPLAVTTATRWDGLPDVPALSEFLPGFEASVWFGLGAPKDTPTEIIATLNKETNAGLADPTLRARLAAIGGTVLQDTPAEFGTLISDETEKWAKVIHAANIRIE